MEFLYIIIGFILLIKFADYFVDASTDIAKKFKVSEIVIGATIVSIGTTLPETMVSATSAFKGHGDIAYGNALGSIICNTALISALSLMFAPGNISRKELKTPTFFFFFAFAIYTINAYVYNGFSRITGIILISIFVVYVLYIILCNKRQYESESKPNDEDSDGDINIAKALIVLLLSAFVIAFASNLLVDNGTMIAKKFGVPESVIGITMLALGTSLPELSTAITSLIKGHSNLSIGNIIGANFFNLVLVSGVAITIEPFRIPTSKMLGNYNLSLIIDVPVAFLVMLILCIPPLVTSRTKRWQGITLILIYVLFIIYQLKV